MTEGIFLMLGVGMLFLCVILYSIMAKSGEAFDWEQTEFEDCPRCSGTGKLDYMLPCDGEQGKNYSEICKECEGKGFVRKERPK